MSNEPFGNGDEASPSFFPQSYPLWAVRAANDDGAAEVGPVIGWKAQLSKGGDYWFTPVVASLGPEGAEGGATGRAQEWLHSPLPEKDSRLIDMVELYLTCDEARERAGELFEEVIDESVRRWPENVSPHWKRARSQPDE